MNMIKFAWALWRGGEETGISRDTKDRKNYDCKIRREALSSLSVRKCVQTSQLLNVMPYTTVKNLDLVLGIGSAIFARVTVATQNRSKG